MFTRLENEVAILERHLRVLDAVRTDAPIEVTTLSSRLPDPANKVRYSVRVLEAENLVTSTNQGIAATDRMNAERDTIAAQLTAVSHHLEQAPQQLRGSFDG